jgi:hypothetical protein
MEDAAASAVVTARSWSGFRTQTLNDFSEMGTPPLRRASVAVVTTIEVSIEFLLVSAVPTGMTGGRAEV